MPNRVDLANRPGANIEAPGATAAISPTRYEVASKLAQLAVGQQLHGEILSRLQDGSFNVRVAGMVTNMTLPAGSQIGQTIPLHLAGLDPQPTFLPDPTNDPWPHPIAEPAHAPISAQANVTGAAAGGPNITGLPAEYDPDGAPTQLSETGKLIGTILRAAASIPAATASVDKAPLLNQAAAVLLPERVAQALRTSLTASGIFYEAHVADWADGKHSAVELAAEPQAQLLMDGQALDTLADNAALTQLLNRQLQTLEQQRYVWQGELIPGQAMYWDVCKDNVPAHSQDDGADQPWQSAVRFELPQLGAVSALVRLQGNRVSIALRASQPDTVAALQGRAAMLADAIAATGTQLSTFSARQDEHA